MRILFVADGRSPIAINWMRFFVEEGYDVHLASTFPYSPDLKLASLHPIPVAFSGLVRGKIQTESYSSISNNGSKRNNIRFPKAVSVRFRTAIRQWLGPVTLPPAVKQLDRVIKEVQPDLIHAMRIPYEGMLTANIESKKPLLLSVWGNDFTLHARSTPWMASLSRLALKRADALHTDCQRDLRLAQAWGFSSQKPAIVLPGGGGVQRNLFYPSEISPEDPVVVNPRGIRAYVRNDIFFRSIPFILERLPGARFLCPAMVGEPIAQNWVNELKLAPHVELLPQLTRTQMADLFRQAQVTVSPSIHDGTPNTLLEAMACGCFPVAGDLESLREWITPGVNGILFDPNDPHALAEAVILALEHPALREIARIMNLHLIDERAEYRQVMEKAEEFYKLLGC